MLHIRGFSSLFYFQIIKIIKKIILKCFVTAIQVLFESCGEHKEPTHARNRYNCNKDNVNSSVYPSYAAATLLRSLNTCCVVVYKPALETNLLCNLQVQWQQSIVCVETVHNSGSTDRLNVFPCAPVLATVPGHAYCRHSLNNESKKTKDGGCR